MRSNRTEAIVRTRTWRGAFAVLGCLACAAGCRFPDFMRSRGATQDSIEDCVPRLTKRQVADVQLSLAQSLEREGELNAALDAYREVAEKHPQRATACWRMAVLHDRQGNVLESEGLYRRALKAEPTNPDIRCDFGYSLYLQKRWAEAEDQLRQAVASKSSHRRAHNNLGLLLAQTERLDEALVEFRQAGCQEAEARANVAFVLTLNHRWDEASAQYELALDANPGSAAAKAGLESLAGIVAKTAPAKEDLTRVGYEVQTGLSRQ